MTTNGIITPLDQEMKNFYLRNADGAIEIKLKDTVQIGIQTRMSRTRYVNKHVKGDVYNGWKERLFIPQFYSVDEMSFKLPKDLYMRVKFKDWKTAEKSSKRPKKRLFGMAAFTQPALANICQLKMNCGFREKLSRLKKNSPLSLRLVIGSLGLPAAVMTMLILSLESWVLKILNRLCSKALFAAK